MVVSSSGKLLMSRVNLGTVEWHQGSNRGLQGMSTLHSPCCVPPHMWLSTLPHSQKLLYPSDLKQGRSSAKLGTNSQMPGIPEWRAPGALSQGKKASWKTLPKAQCKGHRIICMGKSASFLQMLLAQQDIPLSLQAAQRVKNTGKHLMWPGSEYQGILEGSQRSRISYGPRHFTCKGSKSLPLLVYHTAWYFQGAPFLPAFAPHIHFTLVSPEWELWALLPTCWGTAWAHLTLTASEQNLQTGTGIRETTGQPLFSPHSPTPQEKD
jgi:hypothetical protein